MAGKRKGEGQTALITGASMGIGVDLAECFAKDGYDLILTARSEAALKDIAAKFAGKYNVRTTPIALDLGAAGAGQKLADAIKAQGLGVDVLVNNAGFGIAGAFTSTEEAGQLGMIDLNIRALVELTHLYWPSMLANKRGGVINVASAAAFQPGPLMAVYYASKAFVLSFSEALWREAMGTGVHVTCLCPGPTVSHFHSRAGTDELKLLRGSTPMQSAPVARLGYRAFQKNQRVVIAGLRNRILACTVPFAPRRMLLNIVYGMQSPA
ncbi:MAG: SDR family oxidoreductase [Rhizomicrobium sp.]